MACFCVVNYEALPCGVSSWKLLPAYSQLNVERERDSNGNSGKVKLVF